MSYEYAAYLAYKNRHQIMKYLRGSQNAVTRYYKPSPYKDLAYRLKIVERRSKRNTPERKHAYYNGLIAASDGTLHYVNCVNIDEGDASYERSGTKIRLHSINIRINSPQTSTTGSASTDVYLVAPYDEAIPLLSQFTAVPGGHYSLVNGRELRHKSMNPERQLAVLSWYSKQGRVVHYSGGLGTQVLSNPIFFIVKNHSGNLHQFNYTIEITYSDA